MVMWEIPDWTRITVIRHIKYESGQLVETDSVEESQIINLVAPSHDEISLIRDRLNIPEDFLMAALDRDERPRIEIEDEYQLLIIRIPYHDLSSDTPYTTIAMSFILTPNHIVSVCSEKTMVWGELLGNRRLKLLSPADEKVSLLSTIFLRIGRQYLTTLRLIREEADAAELAIHGSMKNEMLIDMLNLEKCLIFFTTSLRANEPIWDRLKKIHGRDLTENEMDLIEDVKIEFQQARELADIYSNILSGMMDAFASVIANNLTVVLKLLTSITIILMIPTLIASVYGMNVELPFQHSPHAFLFTMIISMIISFGGIALFFKKKWF